jgi:hypothetical protein
MKYVHKRLAVEGLQKTKNPETETDSHRAGLGVYNIDTALNLHCGALSVTVESPSHGINSDQGKNDIFHIDPMDFI